MSYCPSDGLYQLWVPSHLCCQINVDKEPLISPRTEVLLMKPVQFFIFLYTLLL